MVSAHSYVTALRELYAPAIVLRIDAKVQVLDVFRSIYSVGRSTRELINITKRPPLCAHARRYDGDI